MKAVHTLLTSWSCFSQAVVRETSCNFGNKPLRPNIFQQNRIKRNCCWDRKKSRQPLLTSEVSSCGWHVPVCVPLLSSFSDKNAVPDARECLATDQYTMLSINVLVFLRSYTCICIAAVLKARHPWWNEKNGVVYRVRRGILYCFRTYGICIRLTESPLEGISQ